MLKKEDVLPLLFAAGGLCESVDVAGKIGAEIAEPKLLAHLQLISEELENLREKYRIQRAWERRGRMQKTAPAA